MVKILRQIKCWLKIHNYKLYLADTSIYRCSNCGQFKPGVAKDTNGLEIFVFSDGSCIKQILRDEK